MRQPVIDPTRTLTIAENVFGPHYPGWFVIESDPVRALRGEPVDDILPPVFSSHKEAETWLAENYR